MRKNNSLIVEGHLTRDAQIREPSGYRVCTVGMAVNNSKTDTVFLDLQLWNELADEKYPFLQKGRKVHAEGYIKIEKWQDKASGQEKQKLVLKCDVLDMLDSKPSDATAAASAAQVVAGQVPNPPKAEDCPF